MKMQIIAIVLYHNDGRRRDLNFALGHVNIITGDSTTGKSTLIDIIDYCLGQNDFNIKLAPHISEKVACYGVLYQFSDRQVFVAKRRPTYGAASRKPVFILEGSDIEIPELASVIENSDDDELRTHFAQLIGIPENEIEPESGLPTYSANIRHTVYYLFQQNTDLINDTLLFFRQGKSQHERTIKDTIPVILGAVREDYTKLKQMLRQKKREYRTKKQEYDEADTLFVNGVNVGATLVAEAQQVGLIDNSIQAENYEDARGLLSGLIAEQPALVSDLQVDGIAVLQERLDNLRGLYVVQEEKITQYKAYQRDTNGYEFAAHRHEDRLAMAEHFEDDHHNLGTCPICGSQLQNQIPAVSDLQLSLSTLRSQLAAVNYKKPVLTNVIDTLQKQQLETRQQIRQVERNLDSLFQEQRATRRFSEPTSRVARVMGRISLYLQLAPEQQDERDSLLQELQSMEREINELEAAIEEAENIDRLEAMSFELSTYLTNFAREINSEYREGWYRFDLKSLGIHISQDGRIIRFGQNLGSSQNYLHIHLAFYLALHRYFIEHDRPVPSFIVFDQPSLPYFPEDTNFDGQENPEEILIDTDRSALRNVFSLLFRICREIFPELQIILLEHANFPDEEFQDAIIENWRSGRALVPSDWLE